jgi:membrane-associated phospholipid phosphatase
MVNAGLVALYAWLLTRPDKRWREILRDWFPLSLTLLGYQEMGWFADPVKSHVLEASWIVWDRRLLHEWYLRAAIELLGPLLPNLLELSYLLVYALSTFCMATLYLSGNRRHSDAFLVPYLLGLFLSYVQFPFWPSEPPRTLFAATDLPGVDSFFRWVNLTVLGHYGIHTSVFPSAHVSGAIAAALGLRGILGGRRAIVRGLFVYAALVAVATVYGRYHYAVDALAGATVGVAAWAVARWVVSPRAVPVPAAPVPMDAVQPLGYDRHDATT